MKIKKPHHNNNNKDDDYGSGGGGGYERAREHTDVIQTDHLHCNYAVYSWNFVHSRVENIVC